MRTNTNNMAGVLDEAQVLNSLQKPRKISIRGTDGKIYNILCKPKDDLRKDQRLMEFNNMINRFLKRDVESSKRRMCEYSRDVCTNLKEPFNTDSGLRHQNICRYSIERGVWAHRMGRQSEDTERSYH